jgi:hypothetical protein
VRFGKHTLMRYLTVELVIAGVLVAAGCAQGGPSGSFQSSTPAATTTTKGDSQAKERLCGALTAAELDGLLGVSALKRASTPTMLGDYTCRWVPESERDGKASVQIQSLPSDVWAKQLPAVLTALENNPVGEGKEAVIAAARSKLLAAGDRLTADQACELWGDLVRINDGDPSSGTAVQYLNSPGAENQLAVVAQRCTQGRFTSVAYSHVGLQDDDETTGRASQAVLLAHDRLLEDGPR